MLTHPLLQPHQHARRPPSPLHSPGDVSHVIIKMQELTKKFEEDKTISTHSLHLPSILPNVYGRG